MPIETATQTRFRALDSLRGIAALLVVFEHCYMAVPDEVWELYPNIHLAADILGAAGHFSVILFFVLSGFVLSLPYFADAELPYRLYLIRRVCRLYPPYVFAVIIAALLFYTVIDFPELVTGSILAAHLLLTGVWEGTVLDVPVWSLIVEMRISVIFPLLVMAVKRFGWFAVAAGIILGYVCFSANVALGAAGEEVNHIGMNYTGTLLLTLRYVPFFLLGIIAAGRLEKFKQILISFPAPAHIFCCVIAMAFHALYAWWDRQDIVSYADIFYGFIAVYFIICAVALAPVARKLCWPVFLWLGDISYSLYLVHVPVLFAVISLLYGYMPPLWTIISAVPVIFAAAYATYVLIERPSIMLGRKLSSR